MSGRAFADAVEATNSPSAKRIEELERELAAVTAKRDLNSNLLEKANGLCAKLIYERNEARCLCAVATNLAKKLQAERNAMRDAAAEDALEHAKCTLCCKVESSGFYTGCMIRDIPEECGINFENWTCDGNGNLSRPSEAALPLPLDKEIEDMKKDIDKKPLSCQYTQYEP